jgi:hypothetical protein
MTDHDIRRELLECADIGFAAAVDLPRSRGQRGRCGYLRRPQQPVALVVFSRVLLCLRSPCYVRASPTSEDTSHM